MTLIDELRAYRARVDAVIVAFEALLDEPETPATKTKRPRAKKKATRSDARRTRLLWNVRQQLKGGPKLLSDVKLATGASYYVLNRFVASGDLKASGTTRTRRLSLP
jgi:hypothetical protein